MSIINKIVSDLGLDPNCSMGVKIAFLMTYLVTDSKNFDTNSDFVLKSTHATQKHVELFKKMVEQKKHKIEIEEWWNLITSMNDVLPHSFYISLKNIVKDIMVTSKDTSEILFYALTPRLYENDEWVHYWPSKNLGPLTMDIKKTIDSFKNDKNVESALMRHFVEGVIHFY